MNIFLFFFTIVISFIVVRIGAIAFELTGMEKSQARFQSLSCFSGTGFTTTEAELITGHAKRRKIATYLMILGNAGLVTLIATFANSIRPISMIERLNFFTIPLPIPASFSPYINILIIIVGTYLIFKLLTKTRLSDVFFKIIRKRIVEKEILTQENIMEQLLAPEGYGISQFRIPHDHPIVDKELKDLNLKEAGIQILMIQREKDSIAIPRGDAKLHANDDLICFGKLGAIREMAES